MKLQILLDKFCIFFKSLKCYEEGVPILIINLVELKRVLYVLFSLKISDLKLPSKTHIVRVLD